MRKPVRSGVAFLLAAIMLLVAAACGDDGDAAPTSEGSAGASGEGLPPGTYTLGMSSMRSGPVAFAGVPMVEGAPLSLSSSIASFAPSTIGTPAKATGPERIELKPSV